MDNLEYYDLPKYSNEEIQGNLDCQNSNSPECRTSENCQNANLLSRGQPVTSRGQPVTAANTHPAIVPDSFETSKPPLLQPKTKIRQSDDFFSENKEHKRSFVNLGDIKDTNNTNCNRSDNLNSFGVKAQSLINLNGHNQFFPTRPKLSLETGVLYQERVYPDAEQRTSPNKYSEVLTRVNKFEKMAVTAPSIQESKPLWAYKDGIRTPTTPPPTAAKMILNLIKSETSPRREISLNGFMTQSLINLPRNESSGLSTASVGVSSTDMDLSTESNGVSTMTMSMHDVLGESKLDKPTPSPHMRKPKPLPPIRTTPVTTPTPQHNNAAQTPPPLPPKNGGNGDLPPRPASKELKLDDILQLCEEYEKQIESEQRLAQSISFTSTPMPKKGGGGRLSTPSVNDTTTASLQITPLSLAPISLSPPVTSTSQHNMADDITLSPVKTRGGNNGETLTPLKCSGLFNGGDPGPPPLSPASSITQSRIKTNGSLPRDSKRGPSPSRVSLTPTSPKVLEGEMFNWSNGGIISPPPLPPPPYQMSTPQKSSSTMSSSQIMSSSQLVGGINPPASPRTKIKTTVGKPPAGSRDLLDDLSSPTSTLKSLSSTLRSTTKSPSGTLRSTTTRNQYNVNDVINEQRDISGNSQLYTSANSSYVGGNYSVSDREAAYASPSDYQGGREEMYDMEGKSQEELYTEARDLLDMMVSSPSQRSRDEAEKSRLDDSTSSYSRVIIGTGLLGTGYNRNTEMSSVLHQLRAERDETILEVSRTANILKDIEQQMEEANRSLDMETSLLEAELSTNLSKLTDLRNQSTSLRKKEEVIESKLENWRKQASKEIQTARAKLTSLESELDKLETEQGAGQGILDTDKELDLLEKIKISHEKLEAERRHFEDLEFQQMELEAGLEHDREEVLRALEVTEANILEAEEEVGDVEKQQQQISYSQEGQNIEEEHLLVQNQLIDQQAKLSALESKMADILAANKRSSDQAAVVKRNTGNQAADDAIKKINDQLTSIRRLSDKLNNVNRLSDQLSKVNRLSDQLTDHMVHDQLLQVNRLSNHIADELINRRSADSGTITWTQQDTIKTNKTEYNGVKPPSGKWTGNLNSAGSGEDSTTDSTSDLPQDSSSPSPSPSQRRYRKKSPSPGPNKRLTKRSSMQRASERRLDTLDGLTSADESIRPSSTDLDLGGVTDASSWVGDCVTMRRGASSRASRPLTRYLPVTTQENFDLRAHIESAGHQIELCSQIIVNSCSCRGYLSKMGARLKVWTKRWFVFDRNKRTLVYYNDKSETKVKGGIYFHSISEVYVDHQTNRTANQRTSFVMKTADRSYLLMAPSPEAMRIWVDVIFTGAEGYREYQD